MTRPAFYFKLNGTINITQSVMSDKNLYYYLSGHVMRRRHYYLPAFTDEEVLYLSESYTEAGEYKDMLLKLESAAFKACESLNAEHDKMQEMMALHDANLKKLNLGYKLISWFRGMGENNGST